MANADQPRGFKPVAPILRVTKWGTTASQTIAIGDLVLIDNAGRISIAGTGADEVCGVAATSVSSSSADDAIWVYDDPDQIFEGQMGGSTGGALADTYTCATATGCFDMKGTTGIQEVDEDNSTDDLFRVIGPGFDPVTGDASAVGANMTVHFRINESEHQLGRAT